MTMAPLYTRRRAFGALWVISASSYVAIWALRLALPLFAAQQTASPLLVALITFAFNAPWLGFSLLAGALVDRLDRARLLRLAAAVQALVLSVALALALAEAIPFVLLAVVALVLGVGETVVETAVAALVPQVVAHDELDRANTRLTGTQNLMELAALVLGGLVASLGLAPTLAVALGCHALALLALTRLGGPYRAIGSPALRGALSGGLRFLARQRVLLTISLMAAVINGCWGAWLAVLPTYAVAPGPMGLSEPAYGLLLAAGSVGGMLGVLLAGPVMRRLGRRWTIGINIVGNAVMFAAPALTTDLWLVGAASLVGGVGGPMWAISAATLQQRLAPAELLGRVSAAARFLGYGGLALGPLVGGLLAQQLGVVAVFLGGGLLTALLLVPYAVVITEQAMAQTSPADPVAA